jgi:hypothetical protein
MTRACAILLVALVPVLASCSQASPAGGATPPNTATTPTYSMEIIEIRELQPYLSAAVKGDTAVSWTSVTSTPGPPEDVAGKAVQEAIRSQASRLAAITYASLSIPAYVTATASMKPSPRDFTGDQLRVDATGEVSGEARWVLYNWQGPRFPGLPDRPQVTRWVQVYALYDLKTKQVVRLIATARGEAGE